MAFTFSLLPFIFIVVVSSLPIQNRSEFVYDEMKTIVKEEMAMRNETVKDIIRKLCKKGSMENCEGSGEEDDQIRINTSLQPTGCIKICTGLYEKMKESCKQSYERPVCKEADEAYELFGNNRIKNTNFFFKYKFIENVLLR